LATIEEQVTDDSGRTLANGDRLMREEESRRGRMTSYRCGCRPGCFLCLAEASKRLKQIHKAKLAERRAARKAARP
jgi:hypothetical protein